VSEVLRLPPLRENPNSAAQFKSHPSSGEVFPSSQYFDIKLNLFLFLLTSACASDAVVDPPGKFRSFSIIRKG
jgi:hypothetical protein